MSRLRQSDFLRTPCPTNSTSLAGSRFFEGVPDDLEDDPELNATAGLAAPKRPKGIKGRNIFATTHGLNAPAGFTSTSTNSNDNLAEPLVKVRQSIHYAGNARRPVGLGAARRISSQQNTRHTTKASGTVPVKRADIDDVPPAVQPLTVQAPTSQEKSHPAALKSLGMPKRGPLREAKSLTGGQLGTTGNRTTLGGKAELAHAGEHHEAIQKSALDEKDTNVAPVHHGPTMRKPKVATKPSAKKPLGKIVRKRSLENDHNSENKESEQKENGGEKYMSFRNTLRLIKRTKMESREPLRSSIGNQDDGELLDLPEDIRRPTVATRHSNPIITNDLVNPLMYESSWLAAQESSLQQLLNALFTARLPSTTERFDRFGLRSQLLKIYSSSPFPLVYRRVQASLLFGALAPAKDIVSRSAAGMPATSLGSKGTKGWGEDLGLRALFLGLFTNTYDINLLSVALEVIVGREIFSGGERHSLSEKERKKTIEGYITKFVIFGEDLLMMPPPPKPKDARIAKLAQSATTDDEDWGTVGWLLRKSVQRALMLVLLLDKAKTERVVKSCLFQPTSEHKTSISVICHLSRLLLPSLGDIVRPLSHINYVVSHKQDPLEEFNYTVDNLAVDLRDGVRLVRTVELLLYPPTADSPNDWYSEEWPLSSHIKFPAIGRPQKIYNVSLALRALEQAGGNKGGVSASDVVDGYRERTVGLLLEMMQRWGFGSLVNFEETRKEVERLERKLSKTHTAVEEDEAYAEATLLKRWAAAVAELHGLSRKVENLTTSFADGSVFLAIVAEYEQYFPTRHTKSVEETLEKKLRALGCNSYFAGMFGKQMKYGQVFDKEFVVGALTYLCSRLLVASSKERAAVMIQRAYRAHYFRTMAHKRINLMILAHDCATVVNTKARVTAAAITIQRAFRKYITEKIDRLIRTVTNIQATARAFLARRQLAETRNAALLVQRTWRNTQEDRFFSRMGIAKTSITGFQAVIRGLAVRERILSDIANIILLQRRWREINHSVRTRRLLRERKGAVDAISTAWLRYSRIRTDRNHFVQTRKATLKLQALTRGYQARKNAPAIFRTLRKRLQRHAASASPSESILARTTKATVLARSDRGFARGILVLEKTTTWSNECCRIMTEDAAAMRFLLVYLEGELKWPPAPAGPNRTVGHAVNVLTNLWRVMDAKAKERIKPSLRNMVEGLTKGKAAAWKGVGERLALLK